MNLFEAIKAAVVVDDLNAALEPVQVALGVTDGLYASHWWDGEEWSGLDKYERLYTIHAYVRDELTAEKHQIVMSEFEVAR